jgi:UDP:flavonoid glycosyltransferase YjiC (YdhE family)
VPVIGIASNLDQFLNMGTLVTAGAGAIMRADRFRAQTLAALVSKMLGTPEYTSAAVRIANGIASDDVRQRFAAIVNNVVGDTPGCGPATNMVKNTT